MQAGFCDFAFETALCARGVVGFVQEVPPGKERKLRISNRQSEVFYKSSLLQNKDFEYISNLKAQL